MWCLRPKHVEKLVSKSLHTSKSYVLDCRTNYFWSLKKNKKRHYYDSIEEETYIYEIRGDHLAWLALGNRKILLIFICKTLICGEKQDNVIYFHQIFQKHNFSGSCAVYVNVPTTPVDHSRWSASYMNRRTVHFN